MFLPPTTAVHNNDTKTESRHAVCLLSLTSGHRSEIVWLRVYASYEERNLHLGEPVTPIVELPKYAMWRFLRKKRHIATPHGRLNWEK